MRMRMLVVVVVVAGLLATFCGRSAAAAEPKRPNVLFLISDDLNNFLGCYGDKTAKTPNIDRLAARGVRFERAYCQFPLCGPSRNSLLTGLYPNSTGIHNNGQVFRQTIPAQPSLPQHLRRAGYFAGRIGKLYHYGVPGSIGTNGHDDPGSWELELNPAGVDRLEEHPKIFSLTPGQFGGTVSWYASPAPEAKHTDALQAADAEWVLERCGRQKDRPFFLGVGFFRPHTPYVAPKAYFEKYPEKDMRVVQGVKEDQADLPEAALGSYKKEQDKFTDDTRRQALQAYYASISFMDAQVGRVLDALDRNGLADNTIVVFTSDHGYLTGEHGLWQKMSLFEESARVPLIIAGPGVGEKGSAAKAPVGLIDVFPTLTELCGVEPPSNLQGQSLVPMMKDPSAMGRGWALTQVTRGNAGGGGGGRRRANAANADKAPAAAAPKRAFGYSLRTPQWRYTEWDEGKAGRELYDHNSDPQELKNLAEDPSQKETVSKLSAQLREAVASTMPKSGQPPELREGTWAPMLVDQ